MGHTVYGIAFMAVIMINSYTMILLVVLSLCLLPFSLILKSSIKEKQLKMENVALLHGFICVTTSV